MANHPSRTISFSILLARKPFKINTLITSLFARADPSNPTLGHIQISLNTHKLMNAMHDQLVVCLISKAVNADQGKPNNPIRPA